MQKPSSDVEFIVQILRGLGVTLTVVVGAVIAAVLAVMRGAEWYWRRRLESTADEKVQQKVREHSAGLERNLENHKAALSLSADAARLTLQRQLTEFSVYAPKRHEVYAEMFRRILEAEGRLYRLYGFRSEPTYKEFSRADFVELFAEKNLPHGQESQLLELLDKEPREGALKRIRKALYEAEKYEALREHAEANNYFLLNELYLSDAAVEAVRAAMSAMHEYTRFVRFPEHGRSHDRLVARDGMNRAVESARQVMRRDLTRSELSPAVELPPAKE